MSETKKTETPAEQKPEKANEKKPAKKRQPAAKRQGQGTRRRQKPKLPMRIIPLGGLDEIGKNITLFEYGNDIIIVDCGITFPDADMPGVDLVIPDFTYVLKNADRIRGIFLTHGHEDHIGSLPYLLKEARIPLYGTRLTLGLVEGKLREHGLSGMIELNVTNPGDVIKLGAFTVEFIHVNHSIPDAVALAIKTELGTIVHTGDFKIDTTPIDGDIIDLARFSQLGREGVLLMMSDSTNATRPGYTMSERKVGESFESLFRKAEKKRLIIATFSSNIHRIQQIVDCAVRYGRKVAVVGRSMLNVVQVGMDLGYLQIPENVLINISLINRYSDDQLVIITTGSQGEPMSALHRMAFSDHRKVEISPNDCIIISASPIPGNEKLVSKVIDELMKLGAEVVYEKMYEVHVSGHACQEEQKLLMGIVKPKFFMPVHGEQTHLRKHAELALSMGIPKENILITSIGRVVELTAKSMKVGGLVPAGRVMVDGLGVGDVGSIVLNDRKHLAQDGIIVVVMTIDSASGEIVSGPSLVSRGFVYVRESEELIDEARVQAQRVAEHCVESGIRDWTTIKNKIKDELSGMMYERTKRSPMILPVIMEV